MCVCTPLAPSPLMGEGRDEGVMIHKPPHSNFPIRYTHAESRMNLSESGLSHKG